MMRLLPVTDAFQHALRSTTNNFGFAWYVSWPWMAVLLPILLIGNIYIFTASGGDPEQIGAAAGTTSILMALINALAFSSIAVNWHRYVLLDEVPQGPQRLRLDDTVWRYFGNTLLIFLIIFGASFVVSFVFVLLAALIGTFGNALAILVIAVLGLLGISAFYRLGIKLPAVALYRRDFGLKDAWQASAGNGWRVLGVALLYFLTAFGAGLALWIVSAAIGFVGGIAALAVLIAIQLVVSWVLTILGVTMLTSLYGFFVERRNF
jgi:hypothetical protein